jgi:Icc-related predicted phosphoesterase
MVYNIKMKIQIVSDLHLEFLSSGQLFDLPVVGDVLVLAGDIGVFKKKSYLYLLEEWADRYKAVIYVAGNHESYNSNIIDVTAQLYNWSLEVENMYVLENDVFHVDGVTFIGCTLWSDLSNPLAAMHANDSMNDFRIIQHTTRKFGADLATQKHFNSVAFLKDALNKIEGKKVVVTHHAPSFRSISPQYAGNLLNDAYATNLEDLVEKASLWVHGHMHESFSYFIGNCEVVCNPYGYSGYEVNKNFNPGLVRDV